MAPADIDPRLLVPYSIGTGIPVGGEAEIQGYLRSIRLQGFGMCLDMSDGGYAR